MNTIEFGFACKEFNRSYRDLFGVIPVPTDYSCTREEFLEALKKAVLNGEPIETYLMKRVHHDDGRME